MEISSLDFTRLKAVNPRTVGWITLRDSTLDYPVVKAFDDTFYLTHNFSDEPSPHGCIFAKYEGAFPGPRCRLYGHNMKDGTMFTALIFYYYIEGYFSSHKTIDLLTENASYTVSVWAAFQVPDDCAMMQFVPTEKAAFEGWKAAVTSLSPFPPEFDLQHDDDILVLSTCRRMDSHPTPGVLLVIGKLNQNRK